MTVNDTPFKKKRVFRLPKKTQIYAIYQKKKKPTLNMKMEKSK